MGGFFVRKLCGAAGLAVHLHKLLPVLVHERNARWTAGHFRALLHTAILANMAIAAFYGVYYWEDLQAAGVTQLPTALLVALFTESAVMLYYLYASRHTTRGPAVALPPGKTPNSPVVNIVTRTTLICTTLTAVIAGRDLFFPGFIIDIIPRDDIYLEWTNALLHSPPEGSPEAADQGLEAPLYIGDKFVGQLAALHLLILCLYKYVSAVGIRYGADGSGVPAARMIWKASFVGQAAVLFCFRCFAHASSSASLDLRWHLVILSFEACILGTLLRRCCMLVLCIVYCNRKR